MTCLENLKFIFMPSYWIMTSPFSEWWDVELRSLMAKHKFRRVDEYTAKLGDTEVWVCLNNFPYSYMTPYGSRTRSGVRPSRETIYKAHKRYQADTAEDHAKAPERDITARLAELETAVLDLFDVVETNHKAVLKAVFATKETRKVEKRK